ncbi:Predicted metal-binding protein [Dethiosulfatibacter aminovorans DSM 17477]|uniref:Predicted metal-binding protein n=1 Tax=Dethiosulfatibacter aminovorans DSM 17477 TaxID=1121476 RepID=A0A1M6HBN9_9FIRM|nr:CGGC domain-containing protein [Dethiosulfatibacter aminovorans]SHJ19605.1 Predicted metal-binding protein [Dethiosulfatibacter aminovorans DSM 17477]
MKIAIIAREKTMERCTAKGCFRAFNNREDSFCDYGEDVELASFMNDGGEFDHKIQKLIDLGVDTVHISTCIRGKNENYEEMAEQLSEYFNIVGYTHGSVEGKARRAVFLDKKSGSWK